MPDHPPPDLPPIDEQPPIRSPAEYAAARDELDRLRGMPDRGADDEARMGYLEGVVEVYEQVHDIKPE